jgi:hypothetical protein
LIIRNADERKARYDAVHGTAERSHRPLPRSWKRGFRLGDCLMSLRG